MRGRLPSGPEYIDKCDGSVEAKERLKAIFATMAGTTRLIEACSQLGIAETRFHQLRELALDGALAAIESRPAGRPSMTSSEAEEMRALRQEVADLRAALHRAEVRQEIALVLPHVRRTAEGGTAVAEGKKTRQRQVKIRKPR